MVFVRRACNLLRSWRLCKAEASSDIALTIILDAARNTRAAIAAAGISE